MTGFRTITMKKILPVLVCLAMIVPLSPALRGQAETPSRIEIVARRFTYNPPEITLTKGKPVTLVLTSEDVTHGLSIPELGVKTEIPKGRATEITMTPEQAGTFTGQCAYFCGPGHGNMKLTVHVEE
jgi:cytochrome c oxidase subunit 2